ncbi:MFS transporter [Streptomyces catenulae]|uniref:MFS transporter n=1 Tax=Streptomyces catenulae TaxID=66875 RepID=A0ABV2Z895_9ACTN|nr:MFS transporter [Streptomyces catenulae]
MTIPRPPAAPAPSVPAPAPEAVFPAPWRALSLVLVGVFMAVLDTFVVLVAAPAVQAGLHASDADTQLILAGYQLAYALALVTGARLGDRYGRRRCFLLGTGAFTLASVACATAPTAGALIAARVAQGLAAAVLFPQVFAVIQVVLPPERRARAFGVLGAVIGLAGVAGQLLGGVLLAADLFGASWRPLFWINVPLGVLTLALAAVYVPESRAAERHRPDLAGTAVLTVALGLLIVPLIEAHGAGGAPWIWAGPVAGAAALYAFVVVERRIEARGGTPLLRPRLLADRAFTTGIALVLLAYCGINSFFLILSLTLQDGLGLDPLAAGLCYVPFAAAFFAGSVATGRASRPGRRLLRTGAWILALGHAVTLAVVTVRGAALTPWALVGPLLLVGLGNGVLVPPLLHTVLAGVRPAEIGMASGVLSTGQQVGGAAGVAVLGLVFYGTLGGAARHDTGAYAHALAAALVLSLGLALAVGALLRWLPGGEAPGSR